MKRQVKIAVIFGTRPEAIKLAPVVKALAGEFRVLTLATAQHRQMLDQMLDMFGIRPDYDLNIMTENQNLTEVTSRSLQGIDRVLNSERPHMTLVQGDTTTAFAAALASYYNKIPVGHVEAGLRTDDKYSPFPEEMNRRLAAALTDLHFAPTEWARNNLLAEGVAGERIHVTGNTGIDALLGLPERPVSPANEPRLGAFLEETPRVILVTAHRRENFGGPFTEMCAALRELVERNPDVGIVYPVHPNPNVRGVVTSLLGAHPRILLIDPLDYGEFATLMRRAYLILTDSGGVQEEAPSLGKPVLILRENTERPEGVNAGVARLVGTRRERIVAEALRLLESEDEYRAMATGVNPYGDGRASRRIVTAIKAHFGIRELCAV